MKHANAMRTFVIAISASAVLAVAAESPPPVTKASDWLGHVVTTRDGKELGTVRDFGLDEHDRIRYVVVSVGSFLIENNLIAVAPDALVRSRTDDGTLTLEADPNALKGAKRFAADGQWPASPDVVRDAAATVPRAAATTESAAPSAPAPTGTATIESRSKTAHLSASERSITDAAPREVAAKPSAPAVPDAAGAQHARLEPITKFDRLDKDGDGVLNRSEFAPLMSPKDSYPKIDANADGVIERQEYDAFEKAHGATD